ncbi:MAG: methyltransferase domain-containing protein [Kiritimatiellia bacterium]
MSSSSDRFAQATLAELDARYGRVRAGLDVGFADAEVSRSFRASHSGVWMTVEDGVAARARTAERLDPKTVLQMGAGGELPFEDHQFEVVLFSRGVLEGPRDRVATLVREAHRVLQGGGCLVFTVEEAVSEGRGWSARAVYELLRDGFDVIGLRRPPWWRFGSSGRTLTVCAGRKNWRNRGVPIVGAAMPVSSAMLSPRARVKI